MIKQSSYTYGGILKDLSKSKFPNTKYYDAKNIRILATGEETAFSLTTEKGNTLVYTIPNYYEHVVPKILHTTVSGNYLILFVYYTTDTHYIYRLNLTSNEIIVLRNGHLNFRLSGIFSSEVFYENENLQKVYWTDGINQMRYINIINPTRYTSLLDICPEYIISVPELADISYGGTHTSGMIQYCYNLVVKNGAQTKVSPRSQLIPIKKQHGGGDINEIVGQINHIKIKDVDTKFDIIRLYSIKYTSYNQSPIVSLVVEESIPKTGVLTTELTFKDDGRVIYNISEKELLFLGGENIVPAQIASKFNFLILGDIKENYFNIPTTLYDTRAYRFQANKSSTKIKNKDKDYTNIYLANNKIVYTDTGKEIEIDHDCINDEYNISTESQEHIVNEGVLLTTSQSVIVPVLGPTPMVPGMLIEDLPYGDYLVKTTIIVEGQEYVYDSPLLENYNSFKIVHFLANKINSSSIVPDGYSISSVMSPYNEGGFDGDGIFIMSCKDSSGNAVPFDVSSDIKVYTIQPVTKTSIINNINDIYAYCRYTNTFGATGTNITLKIQQGNSASGIFKNRSLLKSRELYRFAIQFYNKYGQFTEPKWICDLLIPDGNLAEGKQNFLRVELKNTNILKAAGVVGWQVLRVERTDIDKTIVTQGIVNPCIFQDYIAEVPTNDASPSEAEVLLQGVLKANNVGAYATRDFVKLPSPFMRNAQALEDSPITTKTLDVPWPLELLKEDLIASGPIKPKIEKIYNGACLSYPPMEGDKKNVNFPFAEIYKKYVDRETTTHNTYMFTRMFQLYSPELIFLNPILGNNLKYSFVGKLNNTLNDCGVWGKQIATADAEYTLNPPAPELVDEDGNVLEEIGENIFNFMTVFKTGLKNLFGEKEIKKININDVIADVRLKQHFHLFNTSEERYDMEKFSALHKSGLIGPSDGRSPRQNYYQYYRKYNIDNSYVNTHFKKDVAGNPEIIGKGESSKIYNDPTRTGVELKYTYHNHLFTVISDRNSIAPKETQAAILCVNSLSNECLNIVDSNEATLERLLSTYGISGNSTGLLEISRTVTNQYGGNTYEARSRNQYIKIGKYISLQNDNLTTSMDVIQQAGDIFVNNFKFLRILPNVAQVHNSRYTTMCEIVEYPTESSIDNSCRNDYSLTSWDSNWMPSFDEYHNYNRVYSQEPISDMNIAQPFTFEEVKQATTRLLSTKVKTPGEIIDGWTDILINEELNLNGQYGKLVKLIRNNNDLFFFQNNAHGIVEVQPRVAMQTNDGIGVELGTGQILYNIQYISTASGSTNPYAIFDAPNFIYYIDVINKTINRTGRTGVEGLSDNAGLHAYMQNNLPSSYNNSLELIGVFDNINDEAYFTTPAFTLVFNESLNSFTSFYDFKPKLYIKTPGNLFSSNDLKNIYQHHVGEYCNFYGTVYDSSITFLMNPEFEGSKIFNNLNFKAELYKDNVDEFVNGVTYTLPLDAIQVWNEYQNTGKVSLVYGSNIARKFRDWNLWIPRSEANIMDRIRGNSIYCTLFIDNTENNKLILHDINLLYTI